MVAQTVGLCDPFVAGATARGLTVKIQNARISRVIAQAQPLLLQRTTYSLFAQSEIVEQDFRSAVIR